MTKLERTLKTRIIVSVSTEQLSALNDLSAAYDMPRQHIIRQAITKFLQHPVFLPSCIQQDTKITNEQHPARSND